MSRTASATEWIALHLYQRVADADLIVIATIVDAPNGIVQVDEILKGAAPPTIRLVDTVDGLARAEDQKPLVNGTRELMFLNRKHQGYAPQQILAGRWKIAGAFFDGFPNGTEPDVAAYRQKIRQLVRLQAEALRKGERRINAFVEGLESTDADIRLWAAFEAHQVVTEPSNRLIDAYLRRWPTDAEVRGNAAAAITKWRVTRAAPMLARRLREGPAEERAPAVRALGGTGDRAYVAAVRAAFADESRFVRSSAYIGINHMLGADSIDDLRNGALDIDPHVRGTVAAETFNLMRRIANEGVRLQLRQLAEQLANDPDRNVSETARSVPARWNEP